MVSFDPFFFRGDSSLVATSRTLASSIAFSQLHNFAQMDDWNGPARQRADHGQAKRSQRGHNGISANRSGFLTTCMSSSVGHGKLTVLGHSACLATSEIRFAGAEAMPRWRNLLRGSVEGAMKSHVHNFVSVSSSACITLLRDPLLSSFLCT